MNKITLDFYLAKSKKTINGLLVLFVLLLSTQVSWGQVAQFEFPASSSLVVSTKAWLSRDLESLAAELM